MSDKDQDYKPDATTKALMRTLECITGDRMRMGNRLGQSYNGHRDMYENLGWPKTIDFKAYWGKFERHSVAGRVVDAYPDATWSQPPAIVDPTADEGEETPFMAAWGEMATRLHLYSYLNRADTISGVGQYGVLLYGFSDGKELKDPVEKSTNLQLMYVQPYSEGRAKILTFETDTKNPRFGKPVTYNLTVAEGKTVIAHHSRVLHLAELKTESDTYAMPRMQGVYNELIDLEKITGGSAEMFWRGAFPGYSFEADADVDIVSLDESAMQDQIEKFVHRLDRYMKLQGVKVNTLSPTVSDPSKHYDIQMNNVSARMKIPRRILTGSERGEQSSAQDEKGWIKNVKARQQNYAEPMILRQFITDMDNLGVLDAPPKYEVVWPELLEPEASAKATTAKAITEALAKYVQSGSDALIPPTVFLERILNMPKTVVESFINEINVGLDEDEVDEKEITAQLELEKKLKLEEAAKKESQK